MGKQIYKTRKRKCDCCGEETRDTEKVSERLWPHKPGGGHLCRECTYCGLFKPCTPRNSVG